MIRAFVDGSSGTTGLRILDRLRERKDIQLYTLPEELRKDPSARRDALNSAEVAFLCLPDDAAREAVEMVSNPDTVVIDTSTAHRVSPAWTYGFPEVNGLRQQIQSSCRIANPGCHATGFISLVAPLIGEGALPPEARLSCFSLTGYSGGGKKMIAEYEASGRDPLLDAPRQYALGQRHKHLPEMRIVSGLRFEPVFSPVVAPFYAGMEVTVPSEELSGIVRRLWLQGYFEDVSMEIDHLSADRDSAFLKILVSERPRVSRWSFSGVKSGEKKDLQEVHYLSKEQQE